jgi:hypothetical protein
MADVLKVPEPIWHTKREMASRYCGSARIELILAWADKRAERERLSRHRAHERLRTAPARRSKRGQVGLETKPTKRRMLFVWSESPPATWLN